MSSRLARHLMAFMNGRGQMTGEGFRTEPQVLAGRQANFTMTVDSNCRCQFSMAVG